MFCGKCGSNIPDGSISCPVCGAGMAVPPMQNPGAYAGYAPSTPTKKSNKLPIIIAVAAVVVVAIVLLLVFVVFGGNSGAKSTAVLYFEALYATGDAEPLLDEINDDVLEAYFDYNSKEFGYDEDYDKQLDNYLESVEDDFESTISGVEDEIGDDWTVDIKVIDCRDTPTSSCDFWEEDLDDADLELEEAVIVLVWVNYTNDDGETDGFYDSVTMMKVDGKWYPLLWTVYSSSAYW